MDKDDARKNAATEKARLKAEFKKIMNENNNDSMKGKKEKTSSSSTSSTNTTKNDLTKRKRDEKEIIEVGMRVSAKFDGGPYEGEVTKVERREERKVIMIGVKYDDGEEEECKWPDDDIVIVGSGREKLLEKKAKSGNEVDLSEVEKGGVDIKRKKGTGMFTCGEPG